jgi:hypothetical protein
MVDPWLLCFQWLDLVQSFPFSNIDIEVQGGSFDDAAVRGLLIHSTATLHLRLRGRVRFRSLQTFNGFPKSFC